MPVYCLSLTFASSFSFASIIPKEFEVGHLSQVTVFKGDSRSEFSWSPDGSKVVYELEKSIYLMDDVGEGKALLASGTNPSFSPDGTKILFQREEALYLYDLQTQTENRIGERAINPKFSPAANYVGFLTTDDVAHNLWIYNLDRDSLYAVTDLKEGRRVKYFAFSPQKNVMLYSTVKANPESGKEDFYSLDLHIVSYEGTDMRSLLPSGKGGASFFSPDGHTAAVTSVSPEGAKVFLLDLETGETSPLLSSDTFTYKAFTDYSALPYYEEERVWLPHVSFSPRGDKLAVSSFRRATKMFYLSLYKTTGKKLYDIPVDEGIVQALKWNPHKDQILFLRSKSLRDNFSSALVMLHLNKLKISGEAVVFGLFPLRKEDTFYVPIKPVAEALDATLDWSAKEKILRFYGQGSFMEMDLDKGVVFSNGVETRVSGGFPLVEGILFVPVDVLANVLNMDVQFDSNRQEVVLSAAAKQDQ